MTSKLDQLKSDLQAQRQILEDLLARLQRTQAPSSPGADDRKNFLALLSDSLDRIRRNRNTWLRLDPAEKADHSEIAELLRESQNLILKILVLDGENERTPARAGNEGNPGESAPSAPEGSGLLSKIYGRSSPG